MWPLLLDMTKDESMQSLRSLELEAYAHLVSALRAQGPLNSDKRKLLKDTSTALCIPPDRHKAEVRRAINDEKLNTIAYHVTGVVEMDDWALEGRRLIPLLPRMAPHTAYSAIADEAADNAYQVNKLLPHPAATERKRTTPVLQQQQQQVGQGQGGNFGGQDSGKMPPFRMPEMPMLQTKTDDGKKRKMPVCTENSTLAQHLLGPAKMSRMQHVYKQRNKQLSKEHQFNKLKKDDLVMSGGHHHIAPSSHKTTKLPYPLQPSKNNGPRINVLQNISLQSTTTATTTISEHQSSIDQQMHNESTSCSYLKKPVSLIIEQNQLLLSNNDQNQAPTITMMPHSKLLSGANLKPPTTITTTANLTLKPFSSQGAAPGGSSSNETMQKTLKVCPLRKPITTTNPSTQLAKNQKLIVVSNTQTIPISTSSILHKTLSSMPFGKNISISKNLEKFKIVTASSTSTTIASSSSSIPISINSNNIDSLSRTTKHKLVTVKSMPLTTPTTTATTNKKVIHLSQLIGPKGSIKVLPFGGKILGKSTGSTGTSSSPLFIMSNAQTLNTKNTIETPIVTAETVNTINNNCEQHGEEMNLITNNNNNNSDLMTNSKQRENGKSSMLCDMLKASGIVNVSTSTGTATIVSPHSVHSCNVLEQNEHNVVVLEDEPDNNESLTAVNDHNLVVIKDNVDAEAESFVVLNNDELNASNFLHDADSVNNYEDNETIQYSGAQEEVEIPSDIKIDGDDEDEESPDMIVQLAVDDDTVLQMESVESSLVQETN